MNRLLTFAAAPTLGDENAVIPWDLSTWGFGQWIAALGVFGTLVTLYLTFRKNRHEEVSGKTNVKMQLDKLIDDRVERQLTSAWGRIETLETRVGTLETDIEKERQEKSRIKTVVKRFVTSLVHWDQTGRAGEMPLPSDADMALLEIEPYDTASGAAVQALRERVQRDPEAYG